MMIVYSSVRISRDGTPPDTLFLNPSSFGAPIDGASEVFIKGEYPKIRAAYERAGVPVHDYDRTPPGKVVPAPAPSLPSRADLSAEEEAEVAAILDDDTPFAAPTETES